MPALIQWVGPEIGSTWDSTRVYRSTSETGSYTLLATVTPITTTKYFDITGDSSSWYKISFYLSGVSPVEGPLSAAFYASATATMYTNPTELRKFMQFDVTDFPDDESTTILLEQAHVQLAMDAAGSSLSSGVVLTPRLKLLALNLSASYVCRSLASRSLSKGYLSVSLEGGSIVKAWQALLQLADNFYERYLELLSKDTIDYTATEYLNQVVNADTAQDIIDIQNGVSNALDFQNSNRPSQLSNNNPRSGNSG